ncbi:hydrogenase membrane subunit [Oleiphilus messinensis]|uniref:Hydrogenase membrane subunit n=1 Tax=Oleiphilus messinensis TaxID=141451 RepID=A0A1Y0IBC0_9GAMM|nr:hypothetical protein [Oleiphilus messinensis]ARU57771.1 hydrogenase membrane subunit [Oleiphilus messinensis]
MKPEHDDKQHFFDKPENVKIVLRVFYVCCAVLFLLDFVVHRHIVQPFENLPGFYPLYGFVGCVLLVVIAKEMRKVLMRDEHYYDQTSISDGNDNQTRDDDVNNPESKEP